MKSRLFLLTALAVWISVHLLRTYHTRALKIPIRPSGLNMGPPNRNPDLQPSREYLKIGKKAAIASDVEECSQMGGMIMKEKGGNAADSAVTVALCIGLVNSFSSGIGGGGFIVSTKYNPQTKGSESISIDAREQAPLQSKTDMFVNASKITPKVPQLDPLFVEEPSRYGGLSVGIPGELKGLYKLYKTHGSGRVQWAELINPVIELAEGGWECTPVFELILQQNVDYFKRNYKEWKVFVRNFDEIIECERNGDKICSDKLEMVKKGDIIKRQNFANTLRSIARNGSDSIFYDPNEYIVQNLVKTIQAKNGIVVAQDFERYDVKVSKPLQITFMDRFRVLLPHSMCSSGFAIANGINVVNEHFHQTGNGNQNFEIGGDLTENSTQMLVEILKWMGAARTKLGDLVLKNASEEDINAQRARTEKMVSTKWAREIYKNISTEKTLPSWRDYRPEFYPIEDHGTAHFSIIDESNNAVSMTTSVNLLFGSLLHDPKTGIILNDQMDDFSIPSDEGKNAFDLFPSVYNYPEPMKRPLSSMSPVVVLHNGLPDYVSGAAGGSRIFTTVFQSLVRRYMYKMPLLETIAYPRLHHQLMPNVLYMENYTGTELKNQMISKGHKIEVTESRSVMNGVSKEGDILHAVSDWWRKQGVAWAI